MRSFHTDHEGNGVTESKDGKKTKIETANDKYDFSVQYAKSGRAKCRKCELKITKVRYFIIFMFNTISLC